MLRVQKTDTPKRLQQDSARDRRVAHIANCSSDVYSCHEVLERVKRARGRTLRRLKTTSLIDQTHPARLP